jgi:hypothetical protein
VARALVSRKRDRCLKINQVLIVKRKGNQPLFLLPIVYL